MVGPGIPEGHRANSNVRRQSVDGDPSEGLDMEWSGEK